MRAGSASIQTKRFEIPDRGSSMMWISLACVALMCSFIACVITGAQDNDMWWLLATGREILENGIPYENPFSAYQQSQGIVVQQWLPCVVDYLVYSSFGFVGIGVMVGVLTIALMASMLALSSMLVGDKRSPIPWLLTALASGVCTSYLSVRPQVWSMLAFLWVMYFLEKYRRTGNRKFLFALPLIALIHVNVHMSMMPYDLFIVACYLLPGSYGRIRTSLSSYDRKPVLVSLIAMCIVSLANPYCVNGVMYLVNSLGSASYGNYISEMGTPSMTTNYYCVLALISIILGCVIIGKKTKDDDGIDIPLSVLFIVSVFLSLQHVRNIWLVGLFCLPLASAGLSGVRSFSRQKIFRDDIIKETLCIVCAIGLFSYGITLNWNSLIKEPTDSRSTPISAVRYLDDNDSTATVFTHFNAGGFLEWNGYRVGMDARPELWNSRITGLDENLYDEYIDMTHNETSSSDYLSNKHFDYLIVNNDTKLHSYLSSSREYDKILDGNGYSLFRNRE